MPAHLEPAEWTLLGTGTSMGVPVIGCHCDVCTSRDPHNQRTRAGAAVRTAGGLFLIDTPPEMRLQLVRERIDLAEAIIYTHAHADHIMGLDDVRIFCYKLQRPVKCVLSREESLRMHAKRHPIEMAYRVGCDAEGRLTAVEARMIGDSGAYASVGMKVLERAAGHASGPYHTPAIDVRSVAVRTNNPICGAFRGFGANQAQFAMEGCLDRLAERVGISGWEIRKRNVIRPGQVTQEFVFGAGAKSYDTDNLVLEKYRDDLFRHFVRGSGFGAQPDLRFERRLVG